MITVDVSINGKTIFARTAINTKMRGMKENDIEYRTDANDIISHNPEDGAIKLAIKILKTINEVK